MLPEREREGLRDNQSIEAMFIENKERENLTVSWSMTLTFNGRGFIFRSGISQILASFSISAIFNPKRILGIRNHANFASFSISGCFWASLSSATSAIPLSVILKTVCSRGR